MVTSLTEPDSHTCAYPFICISLVLASSSVHDRYVRVKSIACLIVHVGKLPVESLRLCCIFLYFIASRCTLFVCTTYYQLAQLPVLQQSKFHSYLWNWWSCACVYLPVRPPIHTEECLCCACCMELALPSMLLQSKCQHCPELFCSNLYQCGFELKHVQWQWKGLEVATSAWWGRCTL